MYDIEVGQFSNYAVLKAPEYHDQLEHEELSSDLVLREATDGRAE